MPAINLGRVGFVLRGAWVYNTAYGQLDVVTYNGAAYAARTANTGVIPSSDSSVWQELTGISAAVQSAMNNAAVRFDTAQSLTSSQQSTARTNIDAASNTAVDSLRTTVNGVQSSVNMNTAKINNLLTDMEQAQNDVDDLQEGMTTKAELNLRGASAIPSGDDLNDYLTPGTYYITTTAIAASVQNLPPASQTPGKLFVMYINLTTRILQLFVPYTSNVGESFRTIVIRENDPNGNLVNSWHQYALTDSPAFTGNPTAPTQSAGDNSTKLATTAYADRAAKSASLEGLAKNGIYNVTDEGYVIKAYAINGGVWIHGTSQNCSIIPVSPGDHVTVTANSTGDANIAVLTQYPTPVSGETPPYSAQDGYTGTIVIDRGTAQTYTMPSDAAYLYIYLRALENGTYQRMPAHLLINGYDYARTIPGNISDKAPIDSPIKIRVMQNNLGKMNNGESLAGSYHLLNTDNYQTILGNYKSLYSKYQPDLIGYEEFVAEADIYTTGETPAVDHTENLITALYERLYPNIRYPASAQVTSKLGILSKYPIIDYSRTRIDFTFQWEGQTESSYAFIIYGHVNVGGKPLAYCINAMTQDEDSRLKGVAKRAALLPLILNMFANDDYAMMIADVNNGGTGQSQTSLEYSIAEANDLYNNIIKPAGFETVMGNYFGYSQTWESYDSHYIGSIDNIYYKNNGKIVFSGLQVLTEEADGLASDHVPIIADFTLI